MRSKRSPGGAVQPQSAIIPLSALRFMGIPIPQPQISIIWRYADRIPSVLQREALSFCISTLPTRSGSTLNRRRMIRVWSGSEHHFQPNIFPAGQLPECFKRFGAEFSFPSMA